MARTALMLAAGTILAMALAAPAHAQLSEGGGPVSYSADNLEYFDGDRRLVLTGDVDVVQGDARLRANRLTLFFKEAPQQQQQAQGGLGAGDIERMVADGEVYYVRPSQSARGDHAVYETASDSVTFTGNVVVASDANVVRGETLVLQIGSKQTVIRPGAGQRVRGVFVPQHHPAQPTAPAAPAQPPARH
ncbi:MAG TPA: LptA/OstA family protein [Caulobacterales bacterium]|nr:LptA/OstA family protein [Caulobacterales bacterium]